MGRGMPFEAGLWPVRWWTVQRSSARVILRQEELPSQEKQPSVVAWGPQRVLMSNGVQAAGPSSQLQALEGDPYGLVQPAVVVPVLVESGPTQLRKVHPPAERLWWSAWSGVRCERRLEKESLPECAVEPVGPLRQQVSGNRVLLGQASPEVERR